MRINHRLMFVFSLAIFAVVGAGVFSGAVVAQEDENVSQIALTDSQIANFIAAQKDINAIIATAPQGDQPDPKIMQQLDAAAKEYNFANFAELDEVGENIGLIMSGIDPATKKYVGPDAVIQKDIATIDSEKLPADEKKKQLDELQSELKSPADPVKFPANINLVESNYDKLNAAMAPVQ
jgi:hypothetical protein